MDDIEVWLRTDLVRLDFYISCGGCGKADVLRTGLGACGRGPLHHGGLEEGGGSSAKLTFLFNMWTLVVLALGTASQPHSPIQMSNICGIREPISNHS